MINAFRLNPKIHMDAIRRETTRGNNGSLLGPCGGASRKTADAFFSYITNFVSQRHSVITRGRQFLEPMVYLNVEITDEQYYLLQPTAVDVLVGNLLEDSLGQNAKKKIPSRRINFMSGNVASYSRVLNNSKVIQHIEDVNMLSVCLSKISESRELAKDAAKEKKSQEAKSKEEKKANDQAEFEKKKGELQEELLQDLTIFVATAGTTLKSFTKDKLLNLLKFTSKTRRWVCLV